MSKHSKGIKIETVIIIVLVIIISGLIIAYSDIELTSQEIVDLIKGSLTAVSSVVILWIKGSYDKRKIVAENEEQHIALFEEINETNQKVNTIYKNVKNLKDEQDVMNEHVKHKNFIKSINIKIERRILKLIKKQITLPNEMQVMLIESGRRIYTVLHDLLEGGFDNFNIEYIQIKLIAQAKSLERNINYSNLNVSKAKFRKILKEDVIYPLISEYIRQLNKLATLENGTRRRKLEESTLDFIENLVVNTIKTAEKCKPKARKLKTA